MKQDAKEIPMSRKSSGVKIIYIDVYGPNHEVLEQSLRLTVSVGAQFAFLEVSRLARSNPDWLWTLELRALTTAL
jgi:hypothetical protein